MVPPTSPVRTANKAATKLFLSWSGELSRLVAMSFRDLLPAMIPGVQVFFSPQDLEPGSRSMVGLEKQLEWAHFGLLFLTAENVTSSWINFEAGAITKLRKGRACGILLGALEPSDLQACGPLGQFQHIRYSQGDVLRLCESLNKASGSPVPTKLVRAFFRQEWPRLEQDYQSAVKTHDCKSPTSGISTAEQLEQVLRELKIIKRKLDTHVPCGRQLLEDQVVPEILATKLTERERAAVVAIHRESASGSAPDRQALAGCQDRELERLLDLHLVSIEPGGTYSLAPVVTRYLWFH